MLWFSFLMLLIELVWDSSDAEDGYESRPFVYVCVCRWMCAVRVSFHFFLFVISSFFSSESLPDSFVAGPRPHPHPDNPLRARPPDEQPPPPTLVNRAPLHTQQEEEEDIDQRLVPMRTIIIVIALPPTTLRLSTPI